MTLKSETTSKEVHADLFKALSTQAISMYAGYNNVLGKMSGRNKNIDIENALKLAASDGQITYNEIRQNLKKYLFGLHTKNVTGHGLFTVISLQIELCRLGD